MIRKLVLAAMTLAGLSAAAQIAEIQHASTGGSGHTVTFPYTPTAGNLGLAMLTYQVSKGISVPAGWSQVHTYTNGYYGGILYQHVFVAGDPATYTWSTPGNLGAQMYEIAGYNASAPINKLASGHGGKGPDTVTSPTETPTVAGTLALTFFSPDKAASVTSVSSGWVRDGCDIRQYQTICSSTLAAPTTDTKTAISNTFSISGNIDDSINAILFLAPGSAGTLPLPTPTASPAAGAFPSPQAVTLADSLAGAAIHYTLDGSTPTCKSTLYSAPIAMDATYLLSAVACSGSGRSLPFTGNFVVRGGTVKGASLGLNADLNGFAPYVSSAKSDEWQRDVFNAAVDPTSASKIAFLNSINIKNLYLDDTIGYNVVDSRMTPPVAWGMPPGYTPGSATIEFYPLQSDRSYVPFFAGQFIESEPPQGKTTGDNHSLLLDRATGFIFETYHTLYLPAQVPQWASSSEATFDLTYPSSLQRPYNYTSASAGGTSILQGLLRYDEIARGDVLHALRMTMQKATAVSVNGSGYGLYTEPMKHAAATNTDTGAVLNVADPTRNTYSPNDVYYGERFRLKANFTSSKCTTVIGARMLTQAKHFGWIMDDLGPNFYVSATTDPRWSQADKDCYMSLLESAMDVLTPPAPLRYGANSNYPLDPRQVATNQGRKVGSPVRGEPVPVLTSVSANPTTVTPGACAVLTAIFTGATYGFWDQALPARSGEGRTVCPMHTTVYTFTPQGQSLVGDDGSGDGYTLKDVANGRRSYAVTVTVNAAAH